jgi:hypothetical protein
MEDGYKNKKYSTFAKVCAHIVYLLVVYKSIIRLLVYGRAVHGTLDYLPCAPNILGFCPAEYS